MKLFTLVTKIRWILELLEKLPETFLVISVMAVPAFLIVWIFLLRFIEVVRPSTDLHI